MSARRGPYRKPSKQDVSLKTWAVGDVVTVGSRRWIIRRLSGEDVLLASSNTSNHKVTWTTTLTRLPKKGQPA